MPKNGPEIIPKQADKFTLTFSDGRFQATTDCNSLSGNYTESDNQISFSSIISTKMYCPDSQEGYFSTLLENSESYSFTGKGELIFELKSGGGSVVFK